MKLVTYDASDFTENLRGNVFGGLTAAIVALPLALAFGIASGLGPAAGLNGAIAVGLLAAIFGGTRPQISGPTGPITVIVASVSADMSAANPESGLTMILSTIFLAGLLQVLFGLLRLGKYFIMVPFPVISGFMSGIGIIIILLQLAPLLGFDGSSNNLDAIRALPAQVAAFDTITLAVGGAALAVLFLWPARLNAFMPSPIVVLGLGGLAVLALPAGSLATIGEIPSLTPQLHLPAFDWSNLQAVMTGALMIALLGSIDSLLTSLVADNVTHSAHHSDRELIGQGVGNAVAGLIGGLPGAGATMRTMVNIQAGGTGPSSGVIHAIFLMLATVGLSGLFGSIPLTVLAAILIKVGIDIIDFPFISRINRLPLLTVALMFTVLILTIFVNLIVAVLVGMFIKNLVTLEKLSDLQLDNLLITDGKDESGEITSEDRQFLQSHSIVLVKLHGPLSYSVARGLDERFRALPSSAHLIVDLSEANFVGITSALAIARLVQAAVGRECKVWLIDPRLREHQELAEAGLMDMLPDDHFQPDMASLRNSLSEVEQP